MLTQALMQVASYHLQNQASHDYEKENYFARKKSCEFSSHTGTCIKKAKVNLLQLQSTLEEWRKEKAKHEEYLQEETEKKLLTFNKLQTQTKRHRLESIKSGSTLEVFGQEIEKPVTGLNNDQTSLLPVEQLNGSQASGSQLVQGTFDLLERMEEDRSDMVKLYHQEQARTKALRHKIDFLAYKRIHDLPHAVQREHEKCAVDVQELKWHCAYRGRVETRLKEKVRLAESTNNKISEEISFIEQNHPLIEGKLELENGAMADIQKKQDHTDDELNSAKERLRRIEREFEESKRKADHEQKMLAKRILSLSNELNETLGKLLNAQEEYEQLSQTVITVTKQLETGKEDTEVLDKEMSRILELEKIVETKVENITEEIFRTEEKYQKLVDQRDDLEVKKTQEGTKIGNMMITFDYSIKKKTAELQKLMRSNRNLEKEVKNLKKKIEKCEKEQIADAKSSKRAVGEFEKIAVDLEVIREDTDRLRSIHEKLLLKLDQERVKTAEVEENVRFQAETLKKQSKDEAHARMILQARINADTADFDKKKEESEKKRAKLIKTENEITNVLAAINEQVEKLREKHAERLKVIEGIDKLLQQVSAKHKDQEETLTKETRQLTPTEERIKSDLIRMCEKQEEMDSTTKTYDKKLRDMASSSIIMNKLLLSHETAIEELREELAELQIQLQAGQGLEVKLRKSLAEVQGRSKKHKEQHEMRRDSRIKASCEIQQNIEESLRKNTELAMEYIDYQSKHINQKNEFINAYEKTLITQDSLEDKKTLCELHTRLHDALKCYYELRGIQTRAGLSRFMEMTRISNEKLHHVQNQLETATTNISLFLNANNKSHELIHLQKMKVR